MIQVSRSIIRQFRTAMKKSVALHCPKGSNPPVVMRTDANGLTIHAQHNNVALAVHTDGLFTAERIVVPARALEEFEGREQSNVELAYTTSSKVLARWTDRGVPCAVEYELATTDTATELPELPGNFKQNEAGLLKALDDAMHIVSTTAIRYATDKIQLRGQAGEIAATDGGQLLWQSGFEFPWTEEVLVPRIKVFGCTELFGDSAAIGKTATHVCVRSGSWTIYLPVDKEGRFPKVENVIPKMTGNCTRLRLDENDAEFLAKTLSRLPGHDNDHSPITLDLNGHVAVRARAEDQDRATMAVLSRSTTTGQSLRYAANRNYLARALTLGFTEVQFANADSPAMCQDAHRKYIFIGLGKTAALEPSENELRLSSDAEAVPSQQPSTHRSKPTVKTTPQPLESVAPSNGEHTSENGQHKAGSFGTLLEEAQSLQNTLRDMLLRTNQFITGLKQYHRQTKTMRATLASLRQLQQLEV